MIFDIISRYISAAVRAISIKFGMVTQFDPLDRFECLKFQILKIQDDGGHLKKSKNHHISAAIQAISAKFGILMHFDILDLFDR